MHLGRVRLLRVERSDLCHRRVSFWSAGMLADRGGSLHVGGDTSHGGAGFDGCALFDGGDQ